MGKTSITKSPGQTKKIGRDLAKKILKTKSQKKSVVIGLEGELGSGKTTFLQGFAKGLSIKERVLSPTFIILRKFQMPKSKCQIKSKIQMPNFENFYHIDCYRVDTPKELLVIGFKKIISNPKNIVAIEWSDRIRKILPRNILVLKFKFLNEKERKIVLKMI